MLAFLIAVGAAIAVIVLMRRAARLETSLQELSFRVALLEGPRAAAALFDRVLDEEHTAESDGDATQPDNPAGAELFFKSGKRDQFLR